MNTNLNRPSIALVLSLSVSSAAFATDIGTVENGFFANIIAMMQQAVDFVEGPFGLTVAVIGIAAAILIWFFGSRQGEGLGAVGKAVIATLLIINIPALIVALQGT